MRAYRVAIAVVMAVLLAVSCGGGSDDDSNSADPTSTAGTHQTSATETPGAGADDGGDASPTTAEDPAPTEGPAAPPRIGEVIEEGGSRYRVNAIVDDFPGTEFYAPDGGNRFFVLDITQVGVETGDPYNPFDFKVRTADEVFWDCLGFGGPGSSLLSGEIGQDQRVRGLITCEIAEDASVATVVLDAGPRNPPVVLADLSLGTEATDPYPFGGPVLGPAVGEATEADGSRYTVNSIDDNYPGGFFEPMPGDRRVAVDITQEGTVAGDQYGSFLFTLQTDDDYVYSCTPINTPDPSFPDGELAVGEEVRGWIACEVPEDSVVAAIWADTEFSRPNVVIAVP